MVVSVLAQPEEKKKKKNKKEGKMKVDTGNIPGRVTRSKVVDLASHTSSKRKILFWTINLNLYEQFVLGIPLYWIWTSVTFPSLYVE